MEEPWYVRLFTGETSREEYNRLRHHAMKEYSPLIMSIGVYLPLDKLPLVAITALVSLAVYVFFGTNLTLTCFYAIDDFVVWSELVHHTCLVVLAAFIRVMVLTRYVDLHDVTRHMMNGVFNYEEDLIDPVYQELRAANRKLRVRLITTPAFILVVTGICIGLKPLIDYAKAVPPHPTLVENGLNYRLMFPIICPIPTETLISAVTMNLLMAFFIALVILPAVAGLLFFIRVTTQIHLEFTTLIESLKLLGTRAQRLFVRRHGTHTNSCRNWSLYEDCIECCLKENIQHHQQIKEFYGKFSTVTDIAIAGGFVICTVVLGLGMIVVNMENVNISDLIAFTGAVVAEAMNAFMISWMSEQIGEQNFELYNTVYGLEWFSWRKSNKKLVITFLEGTREPLFLDAFGLATINMEAFGEQDDNQQSPATESSVMNNAYSFLNLVRASESLED